MSDFLIYGLFLVAGIAAGGAYSMWKNTSRVAAGVLAAIAVLAAAGGVLRLI